MMETALRATLTNHGLTVARRPFLEQRYWACGVFCRWADLNVPERFATLNLLGIPNGWRAYSTRGKAQDPGAVEREYRTAADRCGSTPLFLVVGGGQTIARLCRSLPGAVWVPAYLPA